MSTHNPALSWSALGRSALVICALALPAAPAAAQQTLNFSLGGFVPKGEDARVRGDVLNANRSILAFDIRDFRSASVGAEWLFPIGHFLEGGAGASFTRRTVPSVYADFVDNSGNEIEQDVRLRRTPIDLTVRVIPFGHSSPVQPYFGAGLAVINWRYTETGDFVDFGNGNRVFTDEFAADGTTTGAVVLGGLRFVGGAATGGFEVKYHAADAPLGNEFLGSRLDLGGFTYQATFGVRF